MASPEIPAPIATPKLPPLTALRMLARIWRFVRPYRRQVIFADALVSPRMQRPARPV